MYRRFLKYLLQLLQNIHTNSEAGVIKLRQQLYFLDFVERDSDIFIVTYLKSGTTWMQVILYNMLTEGNMDFEHIMMFHHGQVINHSKTNQLKK